MSETYKADKNILLEQYKLYVEMADRISQRRQSANNYFLSVNILLFSFLSYLINSQSDHLTGSIFSTLLAGGISCFIWYRLIRSYKDMNSGKFKVIYEMEQMLDYQPYDREWEKLGRGKNKKLYRPFTSIELYVPWVFCFLYVFLLLSYIYQ